MDHILLIMHISPIWGGASIGFEIVKWTGRLHKKLPPIASFGTRVSPTIKRRNRLQKLQSANPSLKRRF